jgi:hypothetical protein
MDGTTVTAADMGKRELSCGYACDLIRKDGVFNGQQYTHMQTNIRYNHVAVVDRARAGEGIGLNMDSDTIFETDSTTDDIPLNQRSDSMTIRIDGKDLTEGEAIALVIKLRADAEASKADADKAKAEKDAALADKAKAEEEMEKKTNKDAIDAIVKSRLELRTKASKIVAKEITDKFDSMSDGEIRTAVIKTRFPEIKLDGQSEGYIAGLYDAAVGVKFDAAASNRARSAAAANLNANDIEGRTDEGEDEPVRHDSASARSNMIARMQGKAE